jgi:hypothetical protein
MRADKLYRTSRRNSQHMGMATRRMIMDWLIYYVILRETELREYPFRIYINTTVWFPETNLVINFLSQTPWYAYEYATERIFEDEYLRKRFLKLYYGKTTITHP